MKILYTTPVLEHPPAGGPALRVENSVKALSRIGDSVLVSRVARSELGGIAAERFYRPFCREFLYSPSVDGLSGNPFLLSLQRRLRRGVGVEEDARFIVAVARRFRIGVLWFGYGNISFPLIRRIKELEPGLQTVCDTDSVWSRFLSRGIPFEADAVRRGEVERQTREKEREERAWVNLCDVTTAVSDVDAAYYRAIASDPGRVVLFPNAVDLDSYRNPPPPPDGFRRPCLYLAGSFYERGDAMSTATRWMIDEVLPRVRVQLPEIHTYVVGRGSDRMFSALDDPLITVVGKVPSVLPYACHADVALVPLQFESGTRFKILEAAACGMPVVSTTLGAEGLPVVHGEHILLADEPESFARAVITLIGDGGYARRLAENARGLLLERFGVGALATQARAVLERLGTPGERDR